MGARRARNESLWPKANGLHRFQPTWLRAMIKMIIMKMMATIANSTHVNNCDWMQVRNFDGNHRTAMVCPDGIHRNFAYGV